MEIHEDIAVSFVASISAKINQVSAELRNKIQMMDGLPDSVDIGVSHGGVVIADPTSSIKPTKSEMLRELSGRRDV